MLCLITDHTTIDQVPDASDVDPVICAMIDAMYSIRSHFLMDTAPKYFLDSDTWKRYRMEMMRREYPMPADPADRTMFMGVPVFVVE